MASPILIRIPPTPDPQRLTLPGGVSIEHLELVEVIQPALTPLMPFFDILETVLALFDAVKAVPDTIGPPPDPTALAEALQKVAEKVVSLLRLVPQLSALPKSARASSATLSSSRSSSARGPTSSRRPPTWRSGWVRSGPW